MAQSSPASRRIFLTERLVNKQITMEEATELFALMNRELDRMRRQVMTGALPPPPPPSAQGGASPPSPGAARPAVMDNLDELLLFGGPLLGVLAALMKKSGLDMLGPPSKSPAAQSKASSSPSAEGSSKSSST